MRFDVELPIYLSMAVEAPSQESAAQLAKIYASELELGPPNFVDYSDDSVPETRIMSSGVELLDADEDGEPDIYPVDSTG